MQKQTHKYGAPIVNVKAVLLYPVGKTISEPETVQKSLDEDGIYSSYLWGEYALMVTDEPFDFHIQTGKGYQIISKENVMVEELDNEIHLHINVNDKSQILKYWKTDCTINLQYVDILKLKNGLYTIVNYDRFPNYKYVIDENKVFETTSDKLSDITTDGKQMVFVEVLDEY